ncbi:isoprenyl transferase [Sulfobacillus harzensis]|uniref:Isoprenyl transferase n=1 Tax=Sulfobacillus harzensis TaxID=2729629 RepID=A0A7Y0L4P6_9FIRM|nr:isoprenyl transferase [Sulfobacillus harzensis]NMP21819.1 isoprenyl transferase [Sulfobacillus harzensis]
MPGPQTTQLTGRVPRHIAIIMDGNGRWATMRGMDRTIGHRQGVKALKPIVKEAVRLGVEVLTVYAFSTENWRRPSREIDVLMALLVEFLASETPELKDEGVRVRTIGDLSRLPEAARQSLAWAEAETAQETRMVLNLALNYGARDEILRAVNRWRKETPEGTELTEEGFSQYLDTQGLPDPDLLIRSSGEFRVSNFLLWQLAYAEIYISDKLWPDFGPEQLREAIRAYQTRHRRFGGLG